MEIEAKFSLSNAETFRRLQEIDQLMDYTLSTGVVKQIHDTYLDTTERMLLAARYACRRREHNGEITISLKGMHGAEGAVHRREEKEVTLEADGPPETWPASTVRDMVLDMLGESELLPLFDLHQTRTKRILRDGERDVAEVSLDEVHLAVGEQVQTYTEVEVELLTNGTEDDLSVVTQHLQKEWELEPQSLSKFERGLQFVEQVQEESPLLSQSEQKVLTEIAGQDSVHGQRAKALLALHNHAEESAAAEQAGLSPRQVRYWLARFRNQRLDIFPLELAQSLPTEGKAAENISEKARKKGKKADKKTAKQKPSGQPAIGPDDTILEAVLKALSTHFERMLYHESGVREGKDIEAVHDMRVATRRMRAAFQVCGDYLDLSRVAPVIKGLKRTTRALGGVRDLDVFWEKTEHYLDAHDSDLEPLRKVWAEQHQANRKQLIAYLDSKKYRQFKEDFEKMLAKPLLRERPLTWQKRGPSPHRVRHIVPVMIYQRLAVVLAYDEWVTQPDVPMEHLHDLRLAAKSFRYTLEFFEEALGEATREAIKEVKGLQDHLGDLQDGVVASGLLRDFLTWGTWGHTPTERENWPAEPILAPGVAAYLAHRQNEMQHLLDTFPDMWQRINSRAFKQMVAAAIAEL